MAAPWVPPSPTRGEGIGSRDTLAEKARGIASAAFLSLIAGGLWNFIFPINKKLWTSSYVLFAAGLSLLLLALSMWIVDLRSKSAAAPPARPSPWLRPLMVFGTNAIFAYVLSELLASALENIHISSTVNLQEAAYRAILHVVPNVPLASLFYSLAFVAVCWIPTYVLYRQRIFIKI